MREHFSMTTAGGFVLAGIAAVIFATVIAVGYGRSKAPAPVGSSGASGAPGEYLLDVSDVTDGSKLPR